MRAFVGVDEKLLDEADGGFVLQQVGTHVQDLLGDQWHVPTSIEDMDGVPDAAKVLLYCWDFVCEVGGNGLVGLLLNCELSDLHLLRISWALREIGHDELAQRFESGVLLAFQEDSYFAETHDQPRFGHFQLNEKFSCFLDADEGSMALAGRDFDQYAAPYARKNSHSLVAGQQT